MTDVYEFDPDATALCPVCADVVDVNALDDDDPEYVRCPSRGVRSTCEEWFEAGGAD